MNIAYIEPLSRGWSRMKLALFQPFDLHKWFVLGFSAFLAGLTDGPGGRSSSSIRDRGHTDFGEFLRFPGRAWEWLMDNPGWFIFGVFMTLFMIALAVVLTWLSARGRFMFLDNVVHNRAKIADPWKRYGRQGNSLFLWRLVYGLIAFAAIASMIALFFAGAAGVYFADYPREVPVAFIILWGMAFLGLLILLGYISLFLSNFVVPVMYKHELSAVRAWGRFLGLFRRHAFHFLIYGLFVFILWIPIVILIISAGLLTCCIGFLILVIPYIGSVALLPVSVTFRAFSVEYLAQFGPEWNVFPPVESPDPVEKTV